MAVFAFLGLLVSGSISLSWGDGVLKLEKGQQGSNLVEMNIAGNWRGVGKDLSDSDHKLLKKYTYTPVDGLHPKRLER